MQGVEPGHGHCSLRALLIQLYIVPDLGCNAVLHAPVCWLRSAGLLAQTEGCHWLVEQEKSNVHKGPAPANEKRAPDVSDTCPGQELGADPCILYLVGTVQWRYLLYRFKMRPETVSPDSRVDARAARPAAVRRDVQSAPNAGSLGCTMRRRRRGRSRNHYGHKFQQLEMTFWD